MNTVLRKVFLLGTAFLVTASALAQDYQGFTLEQSKAFHQQFDHPFKAWNIGGDFTRYVFLNMPEFWVHSPLRRKGPTKELTVDYQETVANFTVSVDAGKMTLKNYVRNSPTDGVVIVHKGRIVFEDYPRMDPNDRHIWFSVSKTFVSTAVAILEDRGQIDVEKPIDFYLQELNGTAWQGIRIIDILDMASGIDCPEALNESNSCFWEFYDAFGFPVIDKVLEKPMERLKIMQTLRPPGQVFKYTSVNTEVLNWLVEEVSGERFSRLIEREIWQGTGAESNALMLSTPNGDAFSAGGVSSNLRDLARYGLLFTPSGRGGSNPIVSDAYLGKIQKGGRPELSEKTDSRHRALGDNSLRHNTYQWDIVTYDGDFYKAGHGGQGLYISPSKDLVLTWFGTHTEEKKRNQMLRIARQLVKSGLFDE